MHQRLLYYNHVIKPIMMYSSAVWTNCRKDYLDMVFKLQKRAARVILDAPYMSSTIQLFNRLKWLPFYEEICQRNICISLAGDVMPWVFKKPRLQF